MIHKILKLTRRMFTRVLSRITKNENGTHVEYTGPYNNWSDAVNNSDGYESKIIFKKVHRATLEVLNGEALYERDGTAFYKKAKLTATNKYLRKFLSPNAVIIDFGGGLGSTFHLNRNEINKFKCKYYIVEQPNFMIEGNKLSKDYDLPIKYFSSLNNLEFSEADVVIFSSVLHYLPSWESTLRETIKLNPKIILIDRTPITGEPSQIFVQDNGDYYDQTIKYPCWKINENHLFDQLPGYKVLRSWKSDLDPSDYRGYLFQSLKL